MFSLSQSRLRNQLDGLAGTGNFNGDILNSIRARCRGNANNSLRYYLASLYLQLEDTSSADALLDIQSSASREMKKFCRVLVYCRKRGFSVPSLSDDESDCLDYLERVVNPGGESYAQVINRHAGVLVCGNAPGAKQIECPDSWCRIYFNDYSENPRIGDTATIHVVTPSWQKLQVSKSRYFCITGNDIFYRRSNVWKRFIDHRIFTAVFTMPKALWADLYDQLASPPSAGLLTLSYIESLVRQGAISTDLPVMVAGFSLNQTGVNHAYDSIPAAKRHNWAAEKAMYDGLLNKLKNRCSNLVVHQ